MQKSCANVVFCTDDETSEVAVVERKSRTYDSTYTAVSIITQQQSQLGQNLLLVSGNILLSNMSSYIC